MSKSINDLHSKDGHFFLLNLGYYITKPNRFKISKNYYFSNYNLSVF